MFAWPDIISIQLFCHNCRYGNYLSTPLIYTHYPYLSVIIICSRLIYKLWEAKGICYLFGIILSCKNCIISVILFPGLHSPVCGSLFFFFFLFFLHSVAKSHLKKKRIIYYWQWLEKCARCRKVHCFMHLPRTGSISLKYAPSNYDRCDSY